MLNSAKAAAALPASDLDRARKFYGEMLGLAVNQDDETGVEFACGGGTSIFVYPSAFAGTNQATAAGFQVSDLEGSMEDLRSRGVTFEEYDMPGLKTENGIASYPSGRGAWFKDSEGNILSLMQRA